jgi:hypothetical protein
MKCERLLLAASKVVLDLAGPETLPTIATDALVDGCDSPSLRMLAGVADAQSDEARSLFATALAELELPFPTARDAVMILATDIATKVLDGTTAPFLGAQQVWELSLRAPREHLPQLDTFVYAASEWEDRPEDRNIFAEGIVAAARDLLGA